MVTCSPTLLLLVALAASASAWQKLPQPYTEECLVGQKPTYNKSHALDVKWYTIDLDDKPEERWKEVAMDHGENIKELIGVIKTLARPWFHGKLVEWVDTHMNGWDGKLAEPYADELKGIAHYSNVTLGEIVLYNIFYEVFTVCTSIVAADPTGELHHARNLDFGLFMGWNHETHNWDLYEKLQPMIVNVNWTRGGETVYKSVNFAGYIGVYNGVKKDMFSVTMNERFNIVGGYLGIIQWLLGLADGVKFSTLLVRETMEKATSYDEAKHMLSTVPIIAPAYYILGGAKAPQASIISRGLTRVEKIVEMSDKANPGNGWYVLETNYDPDKPVFFLDDRRSPGNSCMQRLTQKQVSFAGLHQVLSSKTNLNKETEYTVLMKVSTGELETHLQSCPRACWPW